MDKFRKVLVDMEMIQDVDQQEAKKKASESMVKKAIVVENHDHLQQYLTMVRDMDGHPMETVNVERMQYKKRTFEVYSLRSTVGDEERELIFDISSYFI